jgi:hypothetical protein
LAHKPILAVTAQKYNPNQSPSHQEAPAGFPPGLIGSGPAEAALFRAYGVAKSASTYPFALSVIVWVWGLPPGGVTVI